jgi:putative ABC transport system permease protein
MIFKELQYALRNLSRAPRFTVACIFTLALALAGTVTLVNLLEAFVFRRLAVAAPEQLIGIYPVSGDASAGFSPQALQALSARQNVLTGVCGVTAGYGALSVQFDSGAPKQRPVEAVTGNCYELLGVTPSIGRLFTTNDVPIAGEPAHVALLSDRIWRQEFGASTDVLGRSLRVEGTPLTIIGVLPMSYHGLNADEAPAIALPISLPWNLNLSPPLAMHAVGRLRPGIGIGEATAHLTTVWPEVFRNAQTATRVEQIPNLRVVPLTNGFSVLRERYRRPLYALVALAGSLLLLACVNIGGLSLGRLLDRRQALAVQLALGAGRSRLAVQFLCETMAIAAASALLAVPIAGWGAQVAGGFLWTGSRPLTLEATPIATTLLFTSSIDLLAALCVAAPGLVALSVQNWDLNARGLGHAGRSGQRRALIAVQIALRFVLAFCAALFTGNLHALRQLPLGYEPARLQWVRLDVISKTAAQTQPTVGYVDALLSEIARLPGVELAAMSTGFGTGIVERLPIRTDAANTHPVDAISDAISPGFFRTTVIPLQQGRDFTWNDVSSRASVAILNRSLADRLFPNGDAVGRTVRLGPREQRVSIVGVAADATPGDPRLQGIPQYYLPLGSTAPPAPAVLLRVKGASVTEASLRRAIEPMGRHQVVRVSTMDQQVDRFLVQERLIRSTSLLFAVLAALVCITGLYAAMSQNIIRRTREIGIRIAIGATPNMVRALVLTETCWILCIGLGLGVPVALAARHAARSLLSGLSPNATALLALTGVAIAAVAVSASAWPAQRASRTPVATALRSE